jgi:hypothetical protein
MLIIKINKELSMNVKLLSLIAFTTVLAACSGKPANTAGNTANQENGKVCKYEKVTGTKIGTRVCRTPEQMKEEKVAADRAMKTLNRGQARGSN